MIRCDECLRANPPTRMTCLYCGTALPLDESSVKILKPALRPPAKHELGYNIILAADQKMSSSEQVADAAVLLRLPTEVFEKILSAKKSLPLARTSSQEEAKFVALKLVELQLESTILTDKELGSEPDQLIRIRGMSLEEEGAQLRQPGAQGPQFIPWSEFILLVSGRLVSRRVEVNERKGRKDENELIAASEFFYDEPVIDLYAEGRAQTLRIPANGFDFACLGPSKSLVASENLTTLQQRIITKATRLLVNNDFSSVRHLLDSVWRLDQETEARGWKREGPARYSMGAATTESNESQFTRFSRLQFYRLSNP